MSTKRAPRKTAEEYKAQAEVLQVSVAEQVEQLRDSVDWQRYLDFLRSFHAYSLNNVLLILAQQPGATRVAGFRQWQAKGRQVRRGARGIRIYGYSRSTTTEEDEHGDQTERTRVRFPVLSVFDIGQTDAIDGAEQAMAPVQLLTGTDDHGIPAALTAHLEQNGWTVTVEAIAGTANGYTDPSTRRVVIGAHLAPEQGAKTFIHEAAHIVLGHADEPRQEYAAHRGVKETEAESVAYIVAGLLGFDTAAYSIGYIAGWSHGDADLIRNTAQKVLTAAHHIATVLTPAHDGEEEAA